MSETAAQRQVPLSVFIQSKGLSMIHQAVLKAHLWEREEGTHYARNGGGVATDLSRRSDKRTP